MDVWVSDRQDNVTRLVTALREFGFAQLGPNIFNGYDMLRMGVPPMRLEILTRISGVVFDECYAKRRVVEIEGIEGELDRQGRSSHQQTRQWPAKGPRGSRRTERLS